MSGGREDIRRLVKGIFEFIILKTKKLHKKCIGKALFKAYHFFIPTSV